MAERSGPDRRLFDLWSRVYDAPLVQRLTYRPEHDAVLAALRRVDHGQVLDVGCGTGQLARRIERDLPRAWVAGCDFSIGMLRESARGGRGSVRIQGDALHLPFGDASFDAVVSTEAFHWFPDQRVALAEFFRVLRPKGRLLVSLVNPRLDAMTRLTRAGSRLVGEPLYWPTRARMRRQVEAAGFEGVTQRFVLRLPAAFILPSVLTQAVRPG
jgi:ubiquinone/menaquinone biosynthesis C-methylase UbiE